MSHTQNPARSQLVPPETANSGLGQPKTKLHQSSVFLVSSQSTLLQPLLDPEQQWTIITPPLRHVIFLGYLTDRAFLKRISNRHLYPHHERPPSPGPTSASPSGNSLLNSWSVSHFPELSLPHCFQHISEVPLNSADTTEYLLDLVLQLLQCPLSWLKCHQSHHSPKWETGLCSRFFPSTQSQKTTSHTILVSLQCVSSLYPHPLITEKIPSLQNWIPFSCECF